jgi:hypothetical protein
MELFWQILPPGPADIVKGGLKIISEVSVPQSLVKVYWVVTLGAASGSNIALGKVRPVVGFQWELVPPVALRCIGVPQ